MGIFWEDSNYEEIETDPKWHEPDFKMTGQDGEYEHNDGDIPQFVDATSPKADESNPAVGETYMPTDFIQMQSIFLNEGDEFCFENKAEVDGQMNGRRLAAMRRAEEGHKGNKYTDKHGRNKNGEPFFGNADHNINTSDSNRAFASKAVQASNAYQAKRDKDRAKKKEKVKEAASLEEAVALDLAYMDVL